MKTKFLIPVLLTVFLAACGSPKDANNANFEKAANNHFAKDCIKLKPRVYMAQSSAYPVTVILQRPNSFFKQEDIDKGNDELTRPFDVLVKAGVLTVQESSKPGQVLVGKQMPPTPLKIYSLTELGKKALINEKDTAMCVGHYKVDEVERFSQPSDMMGHIMANVSLNVSPVDVPKWAENEDLQKFYRLDQSLAKHTKVVRPFVLASDGWVDADDFSN